MELIERCNESRVLGARAICMRCRHARRRTWWGEILPVGKYRCAHPVMREPRALIAAKNEKTHPSARTKIGVVGEFDHPDFRWPWEFSPRHLIRCRGFEF